jgi:rRNA maturation RNase YbeY
VDSYIFFNDNTQTLNLDELNPLRLWIISTAKSEGFLVGELGFVFCDDKYLHKINVEFLKHDTYTDIITFDYGIEDTIAGEIYISLDRVNENANQFQQNAEHEIRRIIIHGVLHLLGYKDNSLEEKTQMTSKEDYYLSLLPDSE